MGQQIRNWFGPNVFTDIFVPLTTPKLAVHTKILKFQSEFLATENNLLMKVNNDLIVGRFAFPSIKEIFLSLKCTLLYLRIPGVHEFVVTFIMQFVLCKSVVKQPLKLTIIQNNNLS